MICSRQPPALVLLGDGVGLRVVYALHARAKQAETGDLATFVDVSLAYGVTGHLTLGFVFGFV